MKKKLKVFLDKIDKAVGSDMVSKNVMRFYVKYFFNSRNIEFIKIKDNIEIQNKTKKIILSYKDIAYLNDCVIYFDLFFKEIKPEFEDGFYILDFSKKKLHLYKVLNKKFYSLSIPEDLWEMKNYIKKHRPKKGDVVFDVGAYIGVSTYLFSKMVGPTGVVYAFEPDTKSHNILLKNINLHKLKNVIPLKKGLWSETTELSFFNENSLGSSVKDIGLRGKNSPSVRIKVWSLEDAYIKLKLKKLNFVKMDIEGAEVEVINGSKDFIKTKKINFVISPHDASELYSVDATDYIMVKIFKKIGYQCECIKSNYGKYSSKLLYASKKK